MLSFDDQKDIDDMDAPADPDQAPSTSGRDSGGSSDEEGDSDRTISPGTISDIEQCLAWHGGERMRLKVTAKFGTAEDGELDVEVGAGATPAWLAVAGLTWLEALAEGGWLQVAELRRHQLHRACCHPPASQAPLEVAA
jgi:hypothetical protein